MSKDLLDNLKKLLSQEKYKVFTYDEICINTFFRIYHSDVWDFLNSPVKTLWEKEEEMTQKKGYTSDDFEIFSNEIAHLGKQIRNLQELFIRIIRIDSGGTTYLTVPFDTHSEKSFSKIRNKIKKDLEENK